MFNLDFENFILNEVMDSTANYELRIAQGKPIEYQVREALQKEMGWITRDSTAGADKHKGIDAWVVSEDGGKTKIAQVPIQIKVRKNTSANVIFWESIKPWREDLPTIYHNEGNKIFNGKDMRCQARFLVSLSPNGALLKFRKVDEVLNTAKRMTLKLLEVYRATGRTFAETDWGEVAVVKDPSQEANFNQKGDVYKVACKILPEAFEWIKDLPLKQPITF